ncbi:MAG: HesA/MoeB/ThiF family protein [Isosphaeraceae bacterium]
MDDSPPKRSDPLPVGPGASQDEPDRMPAHGTDRAGDEIPTAEALVIDDKDRYSRLRLISWWRQERLRAARVLVVGAGALGNEVVKNLALLGLGTIYLIDLDVVETSNLSRSVLFRDGDGDQPKAVVAARRGLELNPEIAIFPIYGDVITDIGLGLFHDVDLVIGCLDNREARLWVNRQCWKVNTPWIDAGIQEIQGVVKVFVPPDSACYECAMTERDYQLLNLRYSCPLLRRDEILAGKVPTAPTIASMMAALQVQEGLKLLHGLPVAAGTALVYNGVANQFYSTRLPYRDDCLSHETYPEPVESALCCRSLVSELFEFARPRLQGPLRLVLDRELVVGLDCPRCQWRGEVMAPRVKVTAAQAICPHCREPALPEFASSVEQDSRLALLPLFRVGIPPYDIVRIDGSTESGFFLLGADRQDCHLGLRTGR